MRSCRKTSSRRAARWSLTAVAGTLVMALPAAAQAFPRPATGGSAAAVKTKFPYTYDNPNGTTTVIDSKPTRIVDIGGESLSWFLSLGIKPIGVATYGDPKPQIAPTDTNDNELTAAELKGIQGVGAYETPDYETIASLHPDLIIVQSDFPATEIQELSTIAPTIEPPETPQADRFDWAGQPQVTALLGVTARLNSLLGRMNQREDALSGFAKGTTVAQVIAYSATHYALVQGNSDLAGTFLAAGATMEDSIAGGTGAGFIGFSDESLPNLTASKVLFIATGEVATAAQVEADPLYPDIPAEKNHQIYFTGWINNDGPDLSADQLQQLQQLMYGVTGLEATMKGSGKYATSRTGVADIDVGNDGTRICWDITASGIGKPKGAQVFANAGKELFGLGKYKAQGCEAITAAHGRALLAHPGKYHVRINAAEKGKKEETVTVLKGGLGLASPSFAIPGARLYTKPSVSD